MEQPKHTEDKKPKTWDEAVLELKAFIIKEKKAEKTKTEILPEEKEVSY